MNTNILNFPILIPPNILELSISLPFVSPDQISPTPGEHYFKVSIGRDGETLAVINISKEVKELKERFDQKEALQDFVNTIR